MNIRRRAKRTRRRDDGPSFLPTRDLFSLAPLLPIPDAAGLQITTYCLLPSYLQLSDISLLVFPGVSSESSTSRPSLIHKKFYAAMTQIVDDALTSVSTDGKRMPCILVR